MFEVLLDGNNLARILQGLWTAVQIAGLSLIIGLLLGVIFGILRTSQLLFIKIIFKIYLEVFRVIPLLVLLFVFYYLLPELFDINLSAFAVSVLVFVLWISSEMSDIVRGVLVNVPKIQVESGKAIGLNTWQLYRYIYLPQSFAPLLPATINLATRVIKTTSILLIIGVPEMIKVGQQVIENYGVKVPTASLWVYGLILILHFLICYPLSKWAKKLEKNLH
jgi:polar amino acid transport system permease protein